MKARPLKKRNTPFAYFTIPNGGEKFVYRTRHGEIELYLSDQQWTDSSDIPRKKAYKIIRRLPKRFWISKRKAFSIMKKQDNEI